MRQAVAIREKLAQDFPNIRGYPVALALAYDALVRHHLAGPDRLAEAEQCCHKAMQLYDDLLHQFPGEVNYQQGRANVLNALGDRLTDAERWDEAEQAYRQALAIIQEAGSTALGAAEYEDWLGHGSERLARVRYQRGDQAEAFRLLDVAIRHLEAALQARPGHPPYQQRLSNHFFTLLDFWLTLPDRRTLDAGLSARLAQKAMAQESWRDFPAFPDILGTALYLAGDYPAAVTTLEKLLTQNPDLPGVVRPRFFLAMAHARLKDMAAARKWYDQAVQGMEKHKLQDEEMSRLRAEAAALLGIKEEE
jgi:tetratricopeptide (TPR) repeat protein